MSFGDRIYYIFTDRLDNRLWTLSTLGTVPPFSSDFDVWTFFFYCSRKLLWRFLNDIGDGCRLAVTLESIIFLLPRRGRFCHHAFVRFDDRSVRPDLDGPMTSNRHDAWGRSLDVRWLFGTSLCYGRIGSFLTIRIPNRSDRRDVDVVGQANAILVLPRRAEARGWINILVNFN